ncbi:MAG: GlsB/YeaQ/YmgE family stress response membrane protein [Candidatus Dadabacteria bacterium]
MGIIAWIIFGLIAGTLAEWILPGKDPGGIIAKIIIGIVGAFIGGFIGTRIFGLQGVTGFNLYSFIIAIIGAIVLLLLYRLVIKRTS